MESVFCPSICLIGQVKQQNSSLWNASKRKTLSLKGNWISIALETFWEVVLLPRIINISISLTWPIFTQHLHQGFLSRVTHVGFCGFASVGRLLVIFLANHVNLHFLLWLILRDAIIYFLWNTLYDYFSLLSCHLNWLPKLLICTEKRTAFI